ncbi:hypothetical protein Bbelb_105080 [Branchiostoma belcheri]|nr:hypothetical protein Bbelb_105080 [Branchiostoma belcheri]
MSDLKRFEKRESSWVLPSFQNNRVGSGELCGYDNNARDEIEGKKRIRRNWFAAGMRQDVTTRQQPRQGPFPLIRAIRISRVIAQSRFEWRGAESFGNPWLNANGLKKRQRRCTLGKTNGRAIKISFWLEMAPGGNREVVCVETGLTFRYRLMLWAAHCQVPRVIFADPPPNRTVGLLSVYADRLCHVQCQPLFPRLQRGKLGRDAWGPIHGGTYQWKCTGMVAAAMLEMYLRFSSPSASVLTRGNGLRLTLFAPFLGAWDQGNKRLDRPQDREREGGVEDGAVWGERGCDNSADMNGRAWRTTRENCGMTQMSTFRAQAPQNSHLMGKSLMEQVRVFLGILDAGNDRDAVESIFIEGHLSHTSCLTENFSVSKNFFQPFQEVAGLMGEFAWMVCHRRSSRVAFSRAVCPLPVRTSLEGDNARKKKLTGAPEEDFLPGSLLFKGMETSHRDASQRPYRQVTVRNARGKVSAGDARRNRNEPGVPRRESGNELNWKTAARRVLEDFFSD